MTSAEESTAGAAEVESSRTSRLGFSLQHALKRHFGHEDLKLGRDACPDNSSNAGPQNALNTAQLAFPSGQPKPGPVAYPNHPINTESQIRVLELLPGAPGDELVARLKTLTLPADDGTRVSMQQDYEALSYTWGYEQDSRTVHVQGLAPDFPITKNAGLALRRLRRSHSHATPRKLWIDQICINQANVRECNMQVRLMGRVFGLASAVVVWLGETEDSLEQGSRDLIRGLSQDHRYLDRALSLTVPRWHEKIWVAQEVANAKANPTFMCGYLTFSSSHLGDIARAACSPAVRTFVTTLALFRPSLTSFDRRDLKFSTTDRAARPCFLSELQILRRTDATDPRDKVYALLSLVSDVERSIVKPDYGKGVDHVFAQAAYAMVAALQSLEPLANCFLGYRRGTSLPSWASDFSHHKRDDPGVDLWLHNAFARSVLGDSGSSSDNVPLEVTYLPRGNQLVLKGFSFDAVDIALPLKLDLDLRSKRPKTPWMMYIYTGPLQKWLKGGISTLGSDVPCHALINLSNRTLMEVEVPPVLWPFEEPPFALPNVMSISELFEVWPSPRVHNGENLNWQLNELMEYHRLAAHGSAIFVTSRGYLGIGAVQVQAGDIVVSLTSSPLPMLLRRAGQSSWTFQGFACVQGVNGLRPDSMVKEESFALV